MTLVREATVAALLGESGFREREVRFSESDAFLQAIFAIVQLSFHLLKLPGLFLLGIGQNTGKRSKAK
jgi:hypothetical protein